MKITICGSINFAEEIFKIKDKLEKIGHEIFLPKSLVDFSIKNFNEANKLKDNREEYIKKIKPYYTREHFNNIEKSDAILVVNIEKNGIKNYIGGATFAEINVALYLKKKIFLLNPIPTDEMFEFIIDEIESVNPIILNGNLEKIE